jgi:hypothetical protein
LGRSRGGLTCKIHLAADTGCRPISRVTTAGHRHDSLAFEPVMAGIRIRRRGPGRPRTRLGQVLGDKAYSSRAIRAHLRRRGITTTIPPSPPTRPGTADVAAATVADHRGSTRRATSSATLSSGRSTSSRATAPSPPRYDKRDFVFRGTVDVASIRIWLRDPVP